MTEERRIVTVLFADVAGSTALGHASDPEDVRALMSAYYEIARRVVQGHGGTLEKFIGDAVMAIFGVPQAHGDDADRALAAALALRAALAEEPETADLRLRIGVNTGEVIAAREVVADFLVTGDAVNVAARLQQAAEPGTILAGQRTIAAAGPRFQFGPSHTISMKGKPDPVGAATLEGASGPTDHRAAFPFVGRASDLAQLSIIASRAFEESRPQLVIVSAPAGTGKSRLAEELVTRIRADRAAVCVATAQCLPFGAAITYLPMRALLAQLLGTEPDAVDLGGIVAAIAATGTRSEEAARVGALVAATLGIGGDVGNREREEFFAAWRSLVEALATAGPTVLVLEDLHWASDSLLDLIEQVTQPRTRAPLVMVALTRPELFDRQGGWGTARRNVTSISLEPLGENETRALLHAIAPAADTGDLDRMAARADGNPFFALELGRAYRGGGGAEGPLPDTVHATMLARLDQLPDVERRVLQLGAVVGRSIQRSAVAQLLGSEPQPALESLADRDLLTLQMNGEYVFRHILIRDVAYGTLPRAERAAAHLELAGWLADVGEGGPEIVAHHYRQAIAHSPRGLPEAHRDRAIGALEAAAAFAKRTGAGQEAVTLLGDAIRVAPPAVQIRLYERVGDALELTDAAVTAYAEAYRRWQERTGADRSASDGARLLRKRLIVYLRWSGSLRVRLEPFEAQRLIAEARRLAADDPDGYERARLDLAEVFFWFTASTPAELRGAPALAIANAEQARRELATRGDSDAESEALDALSSTSLSQEDFGGAVRYAQARAALPGLSLLERADTVAMICWGRAMAGDFAGVLDAFRAHVASLRPGEPEGFYAYPHVWAVIGARVSGRWDEALAICDRLLAMAEQDEFTAQAPVIVAALAAGGYVARARGDEVRHQRYAALSTRIVDGLEWDTAALALHALEFGEALDDATRYLRSSRASTAPVGEIIAGLLFDHDQLLDDALVAELTERVRPRAAILDERLALCRAVRGGADTLREAVISLDAVGLRPDAARAAALLARMTRDVADRTHALARLEEFADRAYQSRIDEPFSP